MSQLSHDRYKLYVGEVCISIPLDGKVGNFSPQRDSI